MTPSSDAARSSINYVLVDGENIPDVDLKLFGDESIHLILLFGARKSKLNVDLVEKLVEHAASVKFIRLTSSGKNALDFALAYYLGQAAAADPAAHFHLISKDTGYDPLIAHLLSRQLKVQRHADYSFLNGATKLPAAKAPKAPPAKVSAAKPDPFKQLVDHLRIKAATRPKTKKRLFGLMKTFLGKDESEAAKENLFDRLKDAGHLTSDDKGGLTFHFPEKG